MPEELQDAIEGSLPPDADSGSSPEGQEPEPDQGDSSEATEPKAESKEPPFHEHPRWKEVMEEKRQAQSNAERLQQQLFELTQKLATPKEPGEDPYADMADEDKRFWKEVDRRAAEQARKIAEAERKTYMQEQQLTRQQMAMFAYKEFQAKHPDISPNSPEENAIAEKVKIGYTPDDAYEIVVGSQKRRQYEEELARIKGAREKTKNKQKLAANLETGGLAPGSPIEPQRKLTVAEFVEMQMRKQAAG